MSHLIQRFSEWSSKTHGISLNWSEVTLCVIVNILKRPSFLYKIFLDNSCGPINIEYPEYLTKIPAFASGYLQGDVVRFDCFQTHWIKGDYEYKCGIVVDYNNPSQWRFEWNKGSQPVCQFLVVFNHNFYIFSGAEAEKWRII